MNLSQLQIHIPKRNLETDPEDIFRTLTLRGAIENIWAPQSEALKLWHAGRTARDVIIEMNTGGGKTLVGLLIAQSLVHETHGYVLYVCPTNQLIEQTAERARECGIEVATYAGGQWQNKDVYDRCSGPCITNYAAVFNGRSIFREHDVVGAVFDDAHVAGDIIRAQFTLRIPQAHTAFQPLANLFRSYFVRSHHNSQFENALHGDRLTLLFVPMFEVAKQRDRMRQVLEKHGVTSAAETKFAWAHLQDHLHCGVVLLSGAGIEITPPILPVQTLPIFGKGTRRIYTTATLPLQTELLRTFGIVSGHHIAPGGKSGEAQRQFLFVVGEGDEEQRAAAKSLVAEKKACIITPSAQAGEEWCPPAVKFDGALGNAGIQAFARSQGTDKLLLAGRYDGIDLPGDACRVLVLDGLPEAVSLLERFLDQSLHVERLRSAHTAIRLVQAMGRIFRSNTDHGAVVVCGNDLQRWIAKPGHQKYLPRLLQQQVQFGFQLQRSVAEGQATFDELLQAVLVGDRDWDELYRNNVGAFDVVAGTAEPEWLRGLVVREAEAFGKLWEGNYRAAGAAYAAIADEAEQHEKSLAAWYRHWEGLAWHLANDQGPATYAFVLAANAHAELGRPATEAGVLAASERIEPSPQAEKIAAFLRTKRAQVDRMFEEVGAALHYGPQTRSLEQALCQVGVLLGLDASRPDNEAGTGPDVLWSYAPRKEGIALEAKTDKEAGGQYRKKDDIGQFHDHVQWLATQYPEHTFYKAIVGRKLPVSSDANPPDNLRVIPLEGFQEVVARLRKLYTFIQDTAADKDVAASAEHGLRRLGLIWPKPVEALPGSLAADLKRSIKTSATEN